MNESSITKHLTDTFQGVEVVVGSGGTFFFYGPVRKLPFATLVTSDEYDQFSDLNRPGVFRLNVGVSKDTFRSLFASPADHDFTALDRVMPHPVYGKMYWVCVLNPSETTFQAVRVLLAEAYNIAVRRYSKRASPADEP